MGWLGTRVIWLGDSYDPKIFQELLADISTFFFWVFLVFCIENGQETLAIHMNSKYSRNFLPIFHSWQYRQKVPGIFAVHMNRQRFLSIFYTKKPRKPRKKSEISARSS